MNMINLKKCPRCDSEMKLHLNHHKYNCSGDIKPPCVNLICGGDCLIEYGWDDFEVGRLHEQVINLIKSWNGENEET